MLTPASRERDFPSLFDRTYLNTAAEGIPPPTVLDALAQYGRDKLLGMDGRALHEAHWHALREAAARAFGLSPEEIGVCSCSSEAFNLAALALRLRAGDEVVINDLDFPAATTPWLSPACPARVRVWRSRAGRLDTDDLLPLLNTRTRLMTASLVSFYNGFCLPLPEVLAAVRQHSPALVALDVTQALGRIPLEIRAADWIVSSTHKWLLGAHGGGLVGVPKARAAEWTAPAGGWFHLNDPFGPHRFEQVRVQPGAASYSVGMPNYPAVYAVRAALDYIEGVGVTAIDRFAQPLVEICFEGLRDLKLDLLTPADATSRAGILAFRHPDAEVIHTRLRAAGIHIMHHAGRLRVSVHGYNTMEDIKHFLASLHDCVRKSA